MRLSWPVANVAILALLAGACARPGPAAGVPTVVVPVAAVSGPPIAVASPADSPRQATDADGHAAGDRVEVELHGAWFPAVLLERRGDRWLALVENDEGSRESHDELVGREHIRVPVTPAPDDLPEDDGDP